VDQSQGILSLSHRLLRLLLRLVLVVAATFYPLVGQCLLHYLVSVFIFVYPVIMQCLIRRLKASTHLQDLPITATKLFSSQSNDLKWYSVNGFSRFASRRDLDLCLGEFKPHAIDPILDPYLYPTGRWAVLLHKDTVELVRHQVNERMGNRAFCMGPFKHGQKAQMRTASRFGISSNSVRFRNVHRNIGLDELRFFLSDYNLSTECEPIYKVPMYWTSGQKAPPFSHYVVHFESPEEAERIVLEKCFSNFEGQPVQMLWYNC
jgi:hypothetical protein